MVKQIFSPKFEPAQVEDKMEKAKDLVYRQPNPIERKKIREEYDVVDDLMNSFYEKEIEAEKLAHELGSIVLETGGQHESSQIYAYENLLKSLAEIDPQDKKNVDAIVEELVFDVCDITKHPIKRIYLLGLLHYYSSKVRLDQIEEQLQSNESSGKDQWMEDQAQIIANIVSSVQRLKKVNFHQSMSRIFELIDSDFAADKGDPEIQSARLAAKLYEPRATKMPSIGKRLVNPGDVIDNLDIDTTDVPKHLMILSWPKREARPRLASQEKIEQAQKYGLDLTARIVREKGEEQMYLEYNTNPELVMQYTEVLREIKDRLKIEEDAEEVERLKKEFNDIYETLKRIVFEYVQRTDPDAAEEIGSPEQFIVLFSTLRDYTEEEYAELDAEIKAELEERARLNA